MIVLRGQVTALSGVPFRVNATKVGAITRRLTR